MKFKIFSTRIFKIAAVTAALTFIAFFAVADIEYPWSKSVRLAQEISSGSVKTPLSKNFIDEKRALLNRIVPLADIKSIEIKVYIPDAGYDFSLLIEEQTCKRLFYDSMMGSVNDLQKIHNSCYDFIPDIIINILTEKDSLIIRVAEISPSSFVEFQNGNRMETITADTLWLNKYAADL